MIRRNAHGRLVAEYETLVPDDLELAVTENAVAYLPMGAIEWHNSHLPFNTDSIIAEGICRRLADETGGVTLPVNPWATACTSRSKGPYPFAQARGTVALYDPELHVRLLRAIVRDVVDNGFRRIVVAAGHVGKDDRDSMETVVREVNEGGQARAVFLYPYLHTKGDHAGHWETLMLLGLRPDLVRRDKSYIEYPYGSPLLGTETDAEGRQKIADVVQALLAVVREQLGL